jgi:hypothetical protein
MSKLPARRRQGGRFVEYRALCVDGAPSIDGINAAAAWVANGAIKDEDLYLGCTRNPWSRVRSLNITP